MSLVYKPWLKLQVAHDYYLSGLSDDLRFLPSSDTSILLARRALIFRESGGGFVVAGRVDRNEAPPHAEHAPFPLEQGEALTFLAFLRGAELLAISELQSTAGPFKLRNRAGSTSLTVGASLGAADLDPDPTAEVRSSGAFASIELQPPTAGWPAIDSSSGHDVVVPSTFVLPIARSSLVWRYHVVLEPGDTAAASLSVEYAPPQGGPYPPGITFDRKDTPAEIQASYPGRSIVTFESSAELPLFESPLTRTALRRDSKTLIADLPNPIRSSAGHVLVELR